MLRFLMSIRFPFWLLLSFTLGQWISQILHMCASMVFYMCLWHVWILHIFSVWVDVHIWRYTCQWAVFYLCEEVSFFWFHPTLLYPGWQISSYLTSQADFGIWRSLRSRCIKLSCSVVYCSPFCPVILVPECQSFSFRCLQLLASAGIWYAVPTLLGVWGDSNLGVGRDAAPVNSFVKAWGAFVLPHCLSWTSDMQSSSRIYVSFLRMSISLLFRHE